MHEIPKDRNNINPSPPVPKAIYEVTVVDERDSDSYESVASERTSYIHLQTL